MKYQCDVIKDLLPLYHDEVCSQESIKIIEQHLLECTHCKAYYKLMEDVDQRTMPLYQGEKNNINIIKKLKKEIFRKKMIVSLISIGIGITIAFGISKLMNSYIVPIEYDTHKVLVEMENGKLSAYITGDNIYRAESKIVQQGNQTNLYFYTATTAAQKYLVPDSKEPSKYNLNDHTYNQQDQVYNINNVYYFVGDYSKFEDLSEEELDEFTESAILVWSKML